jgi:hypothetical protein
MSEEDKKGEGADQPTEAKAETSTDEAAHKGDPAAAAKQGLGLLWEAARGAAEEIKREVEKVGLADHIRAAGREIGHAAQTAAKELEGFIAKAKPQPPSYSTDWPPKPSQASASPQAPAEEAPKPKPEDAPRADAGAAPEGGTDAKGEPRDMRIQIEED